MEEKEKVLFLERYYLSKSESFSDPLRFLKEAKESFSSWVLKFGEGKMKENPFYKDLTKEYNIHIKVLEALIKEKSL